MERTCTIECKEYIDRQNLEGLKELWAIYKEADNAGRVSWDVVFKDVYIHACLKKRREFVTWLEEIYKEFDPISQIALKTVFPYGRHLLRK